MPLLVTLEASDHTILVFAVSRLEADGALPSYNSVDYRLLHSVVIRQFGDRSVRHVVELARPTVVPGWSAVPTESTAMSLLLLVVQPPPLIVGFGVLDPTSPGVEVTAVGPAARRVVFVQSQGGLHQLIHGKLSRHPLPGEISIHIRGFKIPKSFMELVMEDFTFLLGPHAQSAT